jgi:hypothetical protein
MWKQAPNLFSTRMVCNGCDPRQINEGEYGLSWRKVKRKSKPQTW